MDLYYLKPTIKAEPLVWRWYAWSHLISPVQAAAYITERHLKVMQSYIQNPQIHFEAVRNPKMLGGSFIDYETNRSEEIKDLIAFTKKECRSLITLNDDLKEFTRLFVREAQGDSLEEMYKKIPDSLKGMIELTYDLNNYPNMRLLEYFLYRKYYSPKNQSIALSNLTGDNRKFILSTPRLDQEDEVYLDVSFSDSRLDDLFKMKDNPSSLNDIISMFDIPASKQLLFNSFFSTKSPLKLEDRNYKEQGIRIRYFGHACMLIQTQSISILFDPVLSYDTQDTRLDRYTFSDLPDQIDYVIITHNHQDHFIFETLLQLRHKIKHIIFPANNKGSFQDPSIKLILEHIGFKSLIELEEMQTVSLPDGLIFSLPFFGEHSDLSIHSKLSYCIKLFDQTLMFAADSNNLDPFLYDHIVDCIGPIDMLFLGMECVGAPLSWVYGPLLSLPLNRDFDRNRTVSGSDYEKAWAIVKKLQCKKVYIYAMGQEPWLEYILALKYSPTSLQIIESDKLINACDQEGIECERLFGKKEWVLK